MLRSIKPGEGDKGLAGETSIQRFFIIPHQPSSYVYQQEYIKGGERVSNGAYANGEHRWESNVTFGSVHVIKYCMIHAHTYRVKLLC